MNTKQQEALDTAVQGHNLLIMGCAGTGKSFVLERIVETLRKKGLKVQLTCTTGVACDVYPRGMATTVHRFAGILDGRFGPAEIQAVLAGNKQFEEAVQRILQTDVLLIDECSMLSRRVFEILNSACQLKDNSRLFGGIQIILCGDFLQLPPVANVLYQDDGCFCFESSIFNAVLPHAVVLDEIVRQSPSEKQLVKVIKEVTTNNLSEESADFLTSLNRPLLHDATSTTLFATNEQVDSFNRTKILNFPGQLFEYQSSDTGDQKYLHKLTCPKVLWLKIGMPVILLRNISENLYNGLQGTVQGIDKDGPTINFRGGVVKIPKMAFEVFNPSANANVASRVQFPLKPAFSITIHKAQGMTLDSVNVDCNQVRRPGQLGVALSRAKSASGLRVINFHQRHCITHPGHVMDFIDKDPVPLKADMSCCKGLVACPDESVSKKPETSTAIPGIIHYDTELTEETDEHFDDDFNDIIESLTEADFHIPEDFAIADVIESMIYKSVQSERQATVNGILQTIDHEKLNQFVKNQFSKVHGLIAKLNITEPKAIPSSVLTSFAKDFHLYSVSSEYRIQCLLLFEGEATFSHEHMHVCFGILNAVRNYLTREKVQMYEICKDSWFQLGKRTVTVASKARIRYVGGYCVQKVRYKSLKTAKSYMFSTSKEGQVLYEEAEKKLHILNSLREEETHLAASTSYPESLVDINRRQNLNRGLTNVSDEMFHFFTDLSDSCLDEFIGENLITYGEKIFDKAFSKITSDLDLHAKFVSLVSKSVKLETSTAVLGNKQQTGQEEIHCILEDVVLISAQINEVFENIVRKFMMVFLNQFRKDVKTEYKVSKTMAHRKQVKVSKPKTETTQKKSVKSVQPHEICESQQPSTSQLTTSEQLSTSAAEQVPTSEQPSVSETATGCSDVAVCNICRQDHDNDDWIMCTKCNKWLHRTCAGLKNSRWWKKWSAEAAQWICKSCKK